MAKKDFSQEAQGLTPAQRRISEPQKAQEPRKAQKEHKKQEAQEVQKVNNTQGKKGEMRPRMNMAFTDENYDFIRVMSKLQGISYTQFVSNVMTEYREQHGDIYKQAKKLTKGL